MTEIAKTPSRITLSLPSGASPPTLLCSINLPSSSEYQKINDFYQNVAESCADFCKTSLIKYCLVIQEDPRYPLKYRLSSTLTQENENIIIQITAILSDCKTRKILANHTETHFWKNGKYLHVIKQNPFKKP